MPKPKVPSLKKQAEQLRIDVDRLEHGLAASMISFIDVAHRAGAALEATRVLERRLNRLEKRRK